MKIRHKITFLVLISLMFASVAWCADNSPQTPASSQQQQKLALIKAAHNKYLDPINFTLGPEDTIDVNVARHPEFSGVYPVNQEGKIQLKFVGDIELNGLTKKKSEEKIGQAISTYVVNPQVTVTILEYNSKVIYVLGEVTAPGKYNMKSDTVTVRDAVVNAGLPTLSAATRKCRIITPDKAGRAKVKFVDLYSVLYGGNLQYNYEMHPGDVLYVPCTVMSKVIRVINPVTSTISGAGTAATDSAAAKAASF